MKAELCLRRSRNEELDRRKCSSRLEIFSSAPRRHFATSNAFLTRNFAIYLWCKRKRRSYDGIVSQHPRTRNFMPLFAPLFRSSATRKRNDARGIKKVDPAAMTRSGIVYMIRRLLLRLSQCARTILLTIVNEENSCRPVDVRLSGIRINL